MVEVSDNECIDYIGFLGLSIRQDQWKYLIEKDINPEFAKEIAKNQHKTYKKLLIVLRKFNSQQNRTEIADREIIDHLVDVDRNKINKLKDEAWEEYYK